MNGLYALIIGQGLDRSDAKHETWKQGTLLNALHFCGLDDRLRKTVSEFVNARPLIIPGAIADNASRIRAFYHAGYKDVAQEALAEFKKQRVLVNGVTQHANARPTLNWVWIDTAYMVAPSMALMGELEIAFGDLLGFYRILVNENGLLRHLKQEIGVRPEERLVGETEWIDGSAWGRGNGWYVAGCVDTLEYAKKRHPEIEQTFAKACQSLLKYQTAEGAWRVVIDDPDAPPEMSATTAIAYAFLRGVRMGLLPAEFDQAARRAIAEVLSNHFDWQTYQVKDQQRGPLIANLFTPSHMEAGCSYGQAFLAMSLYMLAEGQG